MAELSCGVFVHPDLSPLQSNQERLHDGPFPVECFFQAQWWHFQAKVIETWTKEFLLEWLARSQIYIFCVISLRQFHWGHPQVYRLFQGLTYDILRPKYMFCAKITITDNKDQVPLSHCRGGGRSLWSGALCTFLTLVFACCQLEAPYPFLSTSTSTYGVVKVMSLRRIGWP